MKHILVTAAKYGSAQICKGHMNDYLFLKNDENGKNKLLFRTWFNFKVSPFQFQVH